MDPEALGILAGAVTVGLGQARVAESGGPGSGVGGAAFMGGGVRSGEEVFQGRGFIAEAEEPMEEKQRSLLEQTGGK